MRNRSWQILIQLLVTKCNCYNIILILIKLHKIYQSPLLNTEDLLKQIRNSRAKLKGFRNPIVYVVIAVQHIANPCMN